jgi:hypothetical protein
MGRLLIIPLLVFSAPCRAGETDWGVDVSTDMSTDLAFDIDPRSGSGETQKKSKKFSPACLRGEPEVREVVQAAWEEAGLQPGDDLSRRRRVRAAGWLPKLSGGVSKDMGDRWDYRYEPGTPRVDQLHQDDGLRWDVGLSWDVSKTVFSTEELQVVREAAKRARERMDLAAEVIRLYFARRRLMPKGVPPPGSRQALELLETTATLDAYTGGRLRGRWCRVTP